jgi:calpain-15
MEEEKKE